MTKHKDDSPPGAMSIDEAVRFIVNSMTNEYRRECIRYWREKFGDAYADKVRAQAWEKLGTKKARHKAGL